MAGIIGTAWSGAAERRHRRLQTSDTVARERLEALYLDIIGSARYDLTRSQPATITVGDPPAQRSTDEMLLRQSKIEAFASHAVISIYDHFQKACRAASYWNDLTRARVRENFPNEPTHHFPPEAEGLSADELRQRATEQWNRAEDNYKQLVDLIRKELALA
ncbi:hypothetical protein AB0A91_15535 [Streptomyces sp. NPDC042207]|uniref:hypothetical protein n=1 Tax=Streptomyces sp. NPDC042207 TaxID=3154331 RepID=UPI0033F81169